MWRTEAGATDATGPMPHWHMNSNGMAHPYPLTARQEFEKTMPDLVQTGEIMRLSHLHPGRAAAMQSAAHSFRPVHFHRTSCLAQLALHVLMYTCPFLPQTASYRPLQVHDLHQVVGKE